jgi:alpha-glucosidase
MVWDQARWDKDLRELYRDLISFRKQSRALQSGGFQMLYLDEDILAYQRETEQERVLVAANRSTGHQIRSIPVRAGGVPDGASFVDRHGTEASVVNGLLTIELQKQSASIWQQGVK